tara:strand:- start:237 stop:1139 length:903 start_codon:yes stop_codon:yes gene_type:complete
MEDETVVGAVNPIKKVVSMGDRRYNSQKTIEDEEKELEELLKEQVANSDSEPNSEKDSLEEDQEAKTPEEKTFKKRYGDLRRHSQKQQKDNEEKIIALQEQLTTATKTQIKLPKSETELKEWAKEYPDVAAIIETIAIKKSKEQAEDIEKQLEEINELQATAKREKAEVELLSLHPDFETIRATESFHTWADAQPKWIQDALYENETDAHAASRAIDLYKVDTGIEPSDSKKPAKSSKAAAKLIGRKTAKSVPEMDSDSNKWRESTVDKMSSEQYEKNADSIMEAIRSGEFVYDISGSAR